MADAFETFEQTGRFVFRAHHCDTCEETTLHDLDDDCWGVRPSSEYALMLLRGDLIEPDDRFLKWEAVHYYHDSELADLGKIRYSPQGTYYVQRKLDHVIESFEYV